MQKKGAPNSININKPRSLLHRPASHEDDDNDNDMKDNISQNLLKLKIVVKV